jgi:hypothetical protein
LLFFEGQNTRFRPIFSAIPRGAIFLIFEQTSAPSFRVIDAPSPHERAWREALQGFADPEDFTSTMYQGIHSLCTAGCSG